MVPLMIRYILVTLLLVSPGYAQQTDYKQFGQSAIEELEADPCTTLIYQMRSLFL